MSSTYGKIYLVKFKITYFTLWIFAKIHNRNPMKKTRFVLYQRYPQRSITTTNDYLDALSNRLLNALESGLFFKPSSSIHIAKSFFPLLK